MSVNGIPNMGSIAVTGSGDNRISQIMRNLNESMNIGSDQQMNESVQEMVCPQCGAKFTYDNANNDGSKPTCPACNFEINAEPAYTEENVESQEVIEESVQNLVNEYASLVESQQYDEAKALLESNDATVSVSGDEFILEATRIVVHADGTKEKKKIKKKHRRPTSAQKAGLKKAQKASQKSGAVRSRKKAMKIRNKKLGKKNEMVSRYALTESIMNLFEKEGIVMDKNVISRLVNESYRMTNMNESENGADENQLVQSVVEVLTVKGLEVIDTDVKVEDGIVAVEVLVRDNDSEIYLGEVSDEIRGITDCEVDYDDPEDDEDDPDIKDLVFYLAPKAVITESTSKTNEEEEFDYKEICEEVMKECDMNESDSKDCLEKMMKECKNSKSKNECKEMAEKCLKEYKSSKNESIMVGGMALNESFDQFAGGRSNVLCKINPAFIKANQCIYDADQKTVFKALTESVHNSEGFGLTIDVLNSNDSNLAGLSGAEVSLTADSNYYLLRTNPMV